MGGQRESAGFAGGVRLRQESSFQLRDRHSSTPIFSAARLLWIARDTDRFGGNPCGQFLLAYVYSGAADFRFRGVVRIYPRILSSADSLVRGKSGCFISADKAVRAPAADHT